MDEKLKSENMQKEQFLSSCDILRAIRTGRCRERRYADHIFRPIQILQNEPLRSQIFNIFFASGGKGVLTPLGLTKILRMFLAIRKYCGVVTE